MADNKLYYGDNLEVLRRHVSDESVDLIYLDPPFKSNQDYNVLFEHKDGTAAAAQIQAFEDTWQWDMAAAHALDEVVMAGGKVADAMLAFQRFLGESDMLAYLAMMAPRLVELRRVLKESGSIYLHCDPTASHYLKMLMDAVFGPEAFQNEISWKRTWAHSDSRRFGRIHDILFLYWKTPKAKFNVLRRPLDESYVDKVYRHVDEDGRRYRLDNLSAPGGRGPVYEWHGVTKAWRYTEENMKRLFEEGRIKLRKDGTALVNGYVRYLDESEGVPLQDWWDDIGPIAAPAKERLGFPTQKPLTLLERIIEAGSTEGDVVLDPFCGCGTTIAAAQKLKRRWTGIDITHLAVNLMKHRLLNMFGPSVVNEYDVIGEPTTVEGAAELAKDDPYQFQFWALGLVGARPNEEKKGADKGIDGRLHFRNPEGKDYRSVVISVKAGKVQRSQVHELRGVVGREDAEIGVFISFNSPTKPMREEAASAGFYHTPFGDHPRLQLLTIEELLDGKGIDYPHQADMTYKRAPREQRKVAEQLELGGED